MHWLRAWKSSTWTAFVWTLVVSLFTWACSTAPTPPPPSFAKSCAPSSDTSKKKKKKKKKKSSSDDEEESGGDKKSDDEKESGDDEDGGDEGDEGDDEAALNLTLAPVTYEGEIKDILDEHCLSCHSDAGSGTPPLLEDFDQVSSVIDDMKAEIEEKTMPVGGDLPSADRNLMLDWFDTGAKKSADSGSSDEGGSDGGGKKKSSGSGSGGSSGSGGCT